MRKLLVNRLANNLRKMTTEYAIKPVLYSIVVKNGTKKIQKAMLYTVLTTDSG